MKRILIFAATITALLATGICVAQTTSRGAKREKEACEELALQLETNPRASGSGISSGEAIAFNIAKLQARNELAAQVAAEITGFIRHRAEQYRLTAGAGTEFSVNRENVRGAVTGGADSPRSLSAILEADSSEMAQRVSQILSNTRPICKNTYDRPDGSVQVYVCIEMGLSAQRQAYKELKEEGLIDMDVDNDGNNDIDLAEKEFLLELAKARKVYNAKKNDEF
ncbi:MAG: hypothetical protein LBI89_03015 [Prevotellaceae bacterium]|jgi:hypothetical protein|nr:hypothetical protein [Prevotellaceae bacterium]